MPSSEINVAKILVIDDNEANRSLVLHALEDEGYDVTLAAGGAELVNYRIQGNHMVVDRLFAAAELRLGGETQKKVRIVR